MRSTSASLIEDNNCKISNATACELTLRTFHVSSAFPILCGRQRESETGDKDNLTTSPVKFTNLYSLQFFIDSKVRQAQDKGVDMKVHLRMLSNC